MPSVRLALIVAVSAFAFAIACSDDGAESPVSPSVVSSLQITDLVTGVSANGMQATARSGVPPSPTGGPPITVSGNSTVVNGGTLAAAVTASTEFQSIYLFVGSNTVGLATAVAGGVAGYYEVRLPVVQRDASVVLAFAQTIPLRELELLFAVADPSGRIGPYARLATTVASVGTGDVQVTLSWDADSDVDLHVVDPAGDEVFYANRRSASGGELDLDSNAGCAIDSVRNENITWPVGRAPRGSYTVRVDYWSSCGVPQTNYTVRVNNGGSVQIFSGSFTGGGDQGGAGSGRPITVFERLTGPTAAPPSVPTGASPARLRSKSFAVVPK
jgi:uncharacterized protein YfaP (DUF2135 family)